MRIALSSIAWDPPEDDDVARILASHGVSAIDLAPGKYVHDLLRATDAELRAVRRSWDARGFEITGMQSLLFGTSGLNLFGPDDVRGRMLDYLGAVCRVGGLLGATRLVFGSPRNRDRSGLDDADVTRVATDFFGRLGDRAASNGVAVMLEPNPPVYGANFMTTSDDTAVVVQAVAHPAIRMQLDTGSITINGEDVADVVERHRRLIGHVHVSEPRLVPIGDGTTDHAAASAAIAGHLPDHVVCIEMLRTTEEPSLDAVDRAVGRVVAWYGTQAVATAAPADSPAHRDRDQAGPRT